MEKLTDFAIIFKVTKGTIQEWNIGAERLFGYKAEEAVGQSIEIIYRPEDLDENVPAEEMKTAARKGVAENKRWHARKGGLLFYASGLLHPLYEEGDLIVHVKIVRDLTERVEMEGALEDARQSLDIKVREKSVDPVLANKILRVEMDARARNDVPRLRLMQRVIATQEDERKRISRDIHNHLGQDMTALNLHLQLLRHKFGDDPNFTQSIEKVLQKAGRVDSSIDFIAWELRPAALDELGLEAALNRYIEEWSEHFKIPAESRLNTPEGKSLAPQIEINLYRIAQEALNNIAKHARAKRVNVLLEKLEHQIALIIEDDREGFDVEDKANSASGLGLIGMGERAALLKGKIEIESAEGRGTTIYVRVPAQIADELIM